MVLRLPRELPIQWLIGASIVGMMLMMAGVLLLQSWLQVQQSLTLSLAQSSRQLSTTVEARSEALISNSRAMLQVIASNPDMGRPPHEVRPEYLAPLAAVLVAEDVVGGVYVGYANGDLLMLGLVSRLSPGALPEQQWTEGGEYFALRVVGDRGAGIESEMLLYDETLTLLKRRDNPGFDYDPRLRPWYIAALRTVGTSMSEPYPFYTNGEMGMTLSRRIIGDFGVAGIDLTSGDLGRQIDAFDLPPGARLAILAPDGEVMAQAKSQGGPDAGGTLVERGEPELAKLAAIGTPTPQRFLHNDKAWWGMALPFKVDGNSLASVLIALPEAELMADELRLLWEHLFLAVVLIVLMLPFGILLGRRLGRPLRDLGDQLRDLSRFDFVAYRGVDSRVGEVRRLSEALDTMVGRIGDFRRINLVLGSEPRLDVMLDKILAELLHVTGSCHGIIYLADEDIDGRFTAFAEAGGVTPQRAGADDTGPPDVICLPDSGRGPLTELRERLETQGYLVQSLRDRAGMRSGILLLARQREADEVDDRPWRIFVAEVSAAAAVAVDLRRLLEGEARLLEALIQLVAKATDAKSPHTGGHCSRVPALAEMLMDRVDRTRHGPFASVTFDRDQREAFHLAAWLHDCGKLATPDEIMEKATKLETRYNRLHEIRTRFEVLWRDADIDYWRGRVDGGDEGRLDAQRASRQTALTEAFGWVAEANLGSEKMSEALEARLNRIAEWRWWRHFDDRIGLSRAELKRLEAEPVRALPAEERLLADLPRHHIAWHRPCPPVRAGDTANVWGFDMSPPALADHQGERYNLSISRGTLNDIERFRIQEHVVQTIIMLESLPWPARLKRVPQIAGNHHERMDGKGYPRGIRLSEASLEERVMALADVFEALTASDRPYKTGMPLSRALQVLADMVRDGHLDPMLFQLMLEEGVWQDYAERFVAPAQCDAVDIAAVAVRAGLNHGAARSGQEAMTRALGG
ncbi:HD domain-containing phosphohydrolase [Halomonas sp. V046]|uniref:HD domain-containing phosphohydrolase n=1 Tax=Halomonas sp. V046 TaxID=3459611 RepID=UPI004044674C